MEKTDEEKKNLLKSHLLDPRSLSPLPRIPSFLLPPSLSRDDTTMSNHSQDQDDKSSKKDDNHGVEVVALGDAESIKFVDNSPVENRRQIGLFSAIFIIFNRIIGTG
jgi:hypothetical protein